MRDMNDLKYALGRADDAFIDNVYHTLAGIQKKQVKTPVVNKKLRFIAIAAILCILLTGAALAATNTWGVLDFLSKRQNGTAVLPQASEIVQTNVPQASADQVPADTDIANFTVREAVYDGHNYYIIVDVNPSSAEYLLLGPDAYPQDPVGNMGPLFAGRDGTIADYAEAHGLTMIQTNARVDGVGVQGADFLLQQDGTLTYMISGSLIDDSDKADLELICIVATFENYEGKEVVFQENIKRSSLNITLENTGFSQIVTSIAPAEYTDCGVRIDSITLKGSEMAIYAEISYTVINASKFAATDDGLWFEFVDSDGNPLPDGAASGGGTTTEDGVHYVQETALGAMETLPREVTVRGYNCWEKNKYETHTFELQ